VQAIVVRDSAGERLVLRSTGTGEAAGFQVAMRPNAQGQGQGLSYTDLSFAAPTLDQQAQDALLSVDGVPLRSATNPVSESIPGLRLQLTQVTSSPVEVSIEQDRDAVKAQIQKMVDAYNALQNSLAANTRYDPSTGTAAALQGDQTAVGMQRVMRRLVNTAFEGQPLQRIQDIGIGIQTNGALSIDASKLESALDRMQEIKALFSTGAGGQDGVAKMLGDFARDAVTSDGRVGARTAALQDAIKRNEVEQTRVNERAARAELRYLAMYNAMDSKVGRLNALNSYVSQQLAGLKNNSD
jgi:flagellar hook-associated protein 2